MYTKMTASAHIRVGAAHFQLNSPIPCQQGVLRCQGANYLVIGPSTNPFFHTLKSPVYCWAHWKTNKELFFFLKK